VESLFVNGPAGKLETSLQAGSVASLFIICHPHPHFGGSMDDRIVVALSESLNELGASVIRFNFRGVGRSEGRSEGDRAEVSDAAAIFDWASLRHPNHKIIICGYSFGASISYDLASKRCVGGILLIAPPPIFLEKNSNSAKESLLILGSRDQFVPVAATESFFRDSFDSIRVLEDDHFFTNTLDQLLKTVRAFFKEKLIGI
jgi:alpha/beta superfamily hydrolase